MRYVRRRTGELLNVRKVGVDGYPSVSARDQLLSGCIIEHCAQARRDSLEKLDERPLGEDDVGVVPIQHTYGIS